eukprot:12205782-Alexandrium_andersonii.AAC.1
MRCPRRLRRQPRPRLSRQRRAGWLMMGRMPLAMTGSRRTNSPQRRRQLAIARGGRRQWPL